MKFCAPSILLVTLLLSGLLTGCATSRPVNPTADYDVIVVGGGLGGLSAATHLAVGGLDVLLLEQHHKVGGCASSFSRGEFRFDVSLEAMAGGAPGSTIGDLIDKAGIRDDIELITIPNLFRCVLPGIDFTMPASYDGAIAALSQEFPEESDNIEAFLARAHRVHMDILQMQEHYRNGPLGSIGLMAGFPFYQFNLITCIASTLQEVLDEHFENEQLKAILAQFWFYLGPPPDSVWAPIFMLVNDSYLSEGAFHIRGSSQALSNAYEARIRELGGEVRTGARVQAIGLDQGEVHSVTIDSGETFTTRYVVSNADPYQTYFELIGEEHTPPRTAKTIRGMRPSNSFVGVYLGLDVEASHWGIEDHEIFVNTSLDCTAMFDAMMASDFDQGMLSATFYSNLGDDFYAPPGKSVLVLRAYSDADQWSRDPAEYEAQKQRMADQLLDVAERAITPGLRQHIVVQETITPLALWTFTLNEGGVPYGWEFTTDQSLRIPNETEIPGLFLAGAWSQPSHGFAGVQASGYQAARRILDIEGIE